LSENYVHVLILPSLSSKQNRILLVHYIIGDTQMYWHVSNV